MTIEINNLRLSFIWMETTTGLLQNELPQNAPYAFLGRDYTYQPVFENLLNSIAPNVDTTLQLPWRSYNNQRFWNYYMHRQSRPTAHDCWELLVPARKKLLFSPIAFLEKGSLLLEGFFFPHGQALVATANVTGNFDMAEVVDRAWQVRKLGRYAAKFWHNLTNPVSLTALANQVLADTHQMAFGPNVQRGTQTVEPFSVVTVIQGQGVDPAIPFPQDETIHRSVWALASWSNQWEYDTLPNLDNTCMTTTDETECDVFYAQKRGRVLWFPSTFRPQNTTVPTLACLHRNYVMYSLMMESLVGLTIDTGTKIRKHQEISFAQHQCTRRAVGLLGRMYGGNSSTFRTYSGQWQIEQNDWIDTINVVRNYFNMPALHLGGNPVAQR